MKIINGLYKADSGKIKFDGKEVEISDPVSARKLGISMIFQELNFIPHLTVEDNMFLGREPRNSFQMLDKKTIHRKAEEFIRNEGLSYDPRTKMKDLSVSDMQMIEILKAVSSDASLIIMDEPTSAITQKEVEVLFRKIEELKHRNISIIYISHRMEEIFKIADDITVLRDGTVVHSAPASEFHTDTLISYMVGRKLENTYPQKTNVPGEAVLEICGFSGKGFSEIHMMVRRGEIVGLSGLMGAGRTEVARAVFGLDPHEKGSLLLNGQEIRIEHPWDAVKQGIVMVSEDRREYGIITRRAVQENIAISSLKKRMRGCFLQKREESRAANEMIDLFKIKVPSRYTAIENLSGGNQQKVVLSKWLLTEPEVLIVDEPTRGIDIGAKFEIYSHLIQLASQGMAILMISSELPELLGISDRIYVMSMGKITGEIGKEEMSQETIMRLATGG